MEQERALAMRDGVRIVYRLSRVASSRGLLVLLHGMASNMTRWSEFLARTSLGSRWDTLRLDLRGHGGSCFRGRYTMETWCDDLAQILDADRYGHGVVIGHSMGALAALWFAHLYPNYVRAIILIEPSFADAMRGSARKLTRVRPLIAILAAVVRGLNALGLRRRRLPPRDLWELDEVVRRTLLSTGNREEMIRQYSSPWADFKFNPTANYLQDLTQQLRPLPRLNEIRVPVLTLLSSDTRFTDRAATDRILRELPGCETVTLAATHWPLTETPDEVRGAIERWCEHLAFR
ncbi:MAG TPA: alpha/beta hydrolase [Burkholderiales bacterium]|nr:alpha/beta hydrolase [Burkholderiales bacterium]